MEDLKWLGGFALLFLTLNVGRAEAPKPIGTLVDVGGYRVHLYCIGSGGPTVVITGAGYSFDWGLVQPEVAKFTRICAYDHSGGAWSDPGPADSCPLRVDEIHSALKNAGIKGPFVLVGHSLGALVSRLYASKYDRDIAGMVIVDHSTGPVAVRMDGSPSGVPPIPTRVPRIGLNDGFEKLPARDYELHVWATSRPGVAQLMRRNSGIAPACETEVKSATEGLAHPLGNKPFIALSQAGTKVLRAQLLGLSTNSKQVVAANSGHYVMIDRPDLVIAAIREVVEAARNHTKLIR